MPIIIHDAFGLPSGGTTGQALTKTASGEAWQNAPTELPSGGSAGQILAKTSSGTAWQDAPSSLPSGGTAGQVLTKTATGEAWQDPAGGGVDLTSSDVTGTLPVTKGGTGATTFTSGAVLVGNGTSAVTTRSITNNTSTSSSVTASTNIPTMNTVRYALNRTTSVAAADSNLSTIMARGIYAGTTDLTAGTSSLTNGVIYLVYE